MPELSGPFEECLTAVKERRNLQEILRHYPAERDDLIGMLRLSVDLSNLGAPTPDPAFRLRARNRMLGLAGQRRLAQRRNPFTWLPRPAARLAFAGMVVVGLVAASVSVAAASNQSLPGDPLYGVKRSSWRSRSMPPHGPGSSFISRTFGSTRRSACFRWAEKTTPSPWSASTTPMWRGSSNRSRQPHSTTARSATSGNSSRNEGFAPMPASTPSPDR